MFFRNKLPNIQFIHLCNISFCVFFKGENTAIRAQVLKTQMRIICSFPAELIIFM